MANSIDPDETPRSVVSHLGLHCLLRHVCPNTNGKYGRSLSGKESALGNIVFRVVPLSEGTCCSGMQTGRYENCRFCTK